MAAAQRRPTLRGEMIDVGGRNLRAVWAGPASDRPTIVLEHGAFGCAADWAVVQARLAAKEIRSVAYDRAGLGHSDPGPLPRDGRAIVADLEALLRAREEAGPFVLVGHSMGGLMVRLFALTYPRRVVGLVLVDAATPEVMDFKLGSHAVLAFSRAMRWVSHGARLGMMRPIAAIAGDRIGLDPAASAEKRRIYGSAPHAAGASAEVAQWPATSDQARHADLSADVPVAVVTAGARNTTTALKRAQMLPAIASRNGYIEHVAGAGHASLLGHRFADAIVRGVEHVLTAAHR